MNKTKTKLLEDIEKLKLNFTDELYKKLLEKVIKVNDAEIIYIFKSEFDFAPTEVLANLIMNRKENEDFCADFKRDIWRIKYAKDYGNIDVYMLWRKLFYIYKNKVTYEEFGVFDINEYNENLLLLSTIKGAPTNEIYEFINYIDKSSGDLMKKFLNSDIELDLNQIISRFASLDFYNGDHPKEIYNFVLNYEKNINHEQMDKIILILIEKLQDYYNLILPSRHSGEPYNYNAPNEALDILVLFLTNIKTLTISQKRELVRNSLVRRNYDFSLDKEQEKKLQERLQLEQWVPSLKDRRSPSFTKRLSR